MANHLCGARESMAASRYSRIPTIPASPQHCPRFSFNVHTTSPPIHPKFSTSLRASLMMAARTMGTASVMTSLVVVLVALAFSRAAAQGSGCSSVMMTLSPCMDFISSKAPEPGISCCSVLAGVVQTDPLCLCMVLDGTATSFGISINQTRAMELPGVCKVKAPPISQCAGAPAPTPSNEAATAEGEEVEAAADSPSGNGTSSSTNSKNAASLMATMLIPTCVLLYVF
ncbi:non-specific lipid transfer protein GPI-anchored 5-like isoform X2 [Miscanthus floridulus]|uniref:non-specific lipid transfer protein GPI-anchored 5-like isoform X2 n=1 Tax=Miscanthus floridulus TaxID=154761 RepID=UPI00345A4FB6